MSDSGSPSIPEQYLASGWHTPDGGLLPDLTGPNAMATAQRFRSAEVSPQQLATLRAAFDQVLPETEGTGAQRILQTMDGAVDVTEELLGSDLNESLEDWMTACVERVETDADTVAFLRHFDAVVRVYGALVATALANEDAGRG